MQDEYGDMDSSGETFIVGGRGFQLECGRVLKGAQVRYRTYGTLNAAKTNAMVVCHALTGNAALDSWWGDMLGPGKLFDDTKYFIVCSNILGSCYGTTGPTEVNPDTGKRYGTTFPDVTIRDAVRLQIALVKEGLHIAQVAAVVGGSLGGMQALEWVLLGGPQFVKKAIVMCCGPAHTAWQIAISESQRQAIYADPKWKGGNYDPSAPPHSGLSVARQIAMFTYRSAPAYSTKFGRRLTNGKGEHGQSVTFEAESYLRYQGHKFLSRFDALSYVKCTRLMDSHDIGRGRGGVVAALSSIKQPIMIVSVSSDILYPPSEQKTLHVRSLCTCASHTLLSLSLSLTSNSGSHFGFQTVHSSI